LLCCSIRRSRKIDGAGRGRCGLERLMVLRRTANRLSFFNYSLGSAARLALRQDSTASRRGVDELARETAHLETAVCLGDLIEVDACRDSCSKPRAFDGAVLKLLGCLGAALGQQSLRRAALNPAVRNRKPCQSLSVAGWRSPRSSKGQASASTMHGVQCHPAGWRDHGL
jgi:hypothetical protein